MKDQQEKPFRPDTETVWCIITDLADKIEDGIPPEFALKQARRLADWLAKNGIEEIKDWPKLPILSRETPSGPVQGPRPAAQPRARRTGPTDAAPGASAMVQAMAAVRAKAKDLGDAFAEILEETSGLGGERTTQDLYVRSREMYDFDINFAQTCQYLFGIDTDVSALDDGSYCIRGSGPFDAVAASVLMMKLLRQTGWGMMKDRSPSGWKKTELLDGREFSMECVAEAMAAAKRRRKNGKA